MVDNNEKLVETTENVEETTEETPVEEVVEEPKGKFYTDEELEEMINEKVNKKLDGRVARAMRKYEREMAKYKDTENVLKSQIGGENIDEVNRNLRDLYVKDGVELPEVYQSENERDIQVLATADAQDFIDDGESAMEKEANRLAEIGYDNLSSRDKVVFTILAERLNAINDERELLENGASRELLEDKDFNKFRSNFKEGVSIKEIYELYSEKKQEETINTPGSLSNGSSPIEKTRYTEEEISRLTMEDLNDDKIWEAVRRSMTGS